MNSSLRLTTIALLLAAGILAGAQLGKIAPLVDWYRTELGFSLVLSGWLTSVIGLFVALFALPAGWGIERTGPRRTVLAGSVALAVGGLALPFLASPAAIIGARLVEGLGYLVLVIALPAVMAAISPSRWRATVLAIWSCFVPVGFALSDLSGGWLLPAYGPPTYLFVIAAAFALSALAGILLLARVSDATDDVPAEAFDGTISTTLALPVVLISACFGVWVVMTVSFFAFMPTYVAGEGSGMLLSAGAVALTVPIGNLLAGALVPGRSLRFIVGLGVAGLVVTVLAAWPAFGGMGPVPMTVAAVAVAILGGVTGSALYAAIPLAVPRGGSVSVAIGLVAQAGGIGTLFGPPFAGWVIETAGWPGFAAFTAVTALVSIVIVAQLLFRRRQDASRIP